MMTGAEWPLGVSLKGRGLSGLAGLKERGFSCWATTSKNKRLKKTFFDAVAFAGIS